MHLIFLTSLCCDFCKTLILQRKKSKEPWTFNSQIAGFKTVYKGLTFLTVRGAGHMAPQWRAPEMQYVIQQYINNRPF